MQNKYSMQKKGATYQVFRNDDYDLTFYVREAGKAENGLKVFEVIQPFNGKADKLDELEFQTLQETMGVKFVDMITEKEMLAEGKNKAIDDSQLEQWK